ncbi:MAG TPA: peptidase, partial [Croceibacterium sp.]|nr:peptidase [Croceibacterium sp.]
MTYCVGIMLDHGLVLMSDTRTNSGVDNISVFRKMFTWSTPGERIISIMTAGNLATTQAVISELEERSKTPEDRHNSLLEAPTM